MTATDWLAEATKKLEQSGIGTARLDAFVLLEDVLGKDRAWLLAHADTQISADQTALLTKLLNERAKHTPLAYVRGHTEFYGRTFVITPAVLEPRPESETMIDCLKKLPDLPPNACVADVGAGSGALGITAKLELPDLSVELLEIDEAALKIAQINVDKYTMDVPVIRSDLVESSGHANDVLLCNLPYVPDDYQINEAAALEPKIAIFGGQDGLNLYRKLFQQVAKLPKRPLYILSESLPPQQPALQQIAEASGYRLRDSEDFIQVFTHGPR